MKNNKANNEEINRSFCPQYLIIHDIQIDPSILMRSVPLLRKNFFGKVLIVDSEEIFALKKIDVQGVSQDEEYRI